MTIKMIIDDYFPIKADNTFIFCKVNKNTNNIWPMILEKAWAKINGCYENTINGNIDNAFNFLTPCPYKKYYHDIKYPHFYNNCSCHIDYLKLSLPFLKPYATTTLHYQHRFF